jgi:hypothetical protein
MSESLSTRIARFVQTQPARRSGKGRAAVIALRTEIREAVSDGWSVRAIWQTLHAEGAVQVGYHAFRRYVAELLPSQATEEVRAPSAPHVPAHRPAAPLTRTEPAAAATRTEERPRAFRHERVPRKRDIYG